MARSRKSKGNTWVLGAVIVPPAYLQTGGQNARREDVEPPISHKEASKTPPSREEEKCPKTNRRRTKEGVSEKKSVRLEASEEEQSDGKEAPGIVGRNHNVVLDFASTVTSNAGPDLSGWGSATARTNLSTAREGTSRPQDLGPRRHAGTGLASSAEAAPYVEEREYDEIFGLEGLEDNNTEVRPENRSKRGRHGKKTKAHIRISSLNVKGRRSHTEEGEIVEKINEIPTMMKNKRVNVLALQETHYDEDYVAEITERFGDKIHVEYSRAPGGRASRAEGVALMFYKPNTNVLGLTRREIVPGRGLVVAAPWHGDDVMKVMVGYAPNAPKENAAYWRTCLGFVEEFPEWKPDVACIDCNLAPAALDRLPAHEDDREAVEAMNAFFRACDLVDGWREENPDTAAFTFMQTTGCPSSSRIDRICIKRSRMAQSRSWEMETTKADGIDTDHKRVSCELTTASAPEQGHGRYTIPSYVAKTKDMTKLVNDSGVQLIKDMERASGANRTAQKNPQKLWAAWKEKIGEELRKEAKKIVPKGKEKIDKLNRELKLVLKSTITTEEHKQRETARIEREISKIGSEMWQERKATAKANQAILGETNSKYYTRIIKGERARDPIHSLKIPETNPPQYERDPEKMTRMMGEYHADLQSKGISPEAERVEGQRKAFSSSINKLSEEAKIRLREHSKEEAEMGTGERNGL
ncbi:DNase I-like protein [Hymenopellis radicata]|nr:DNase I-like protein [Hymenopellis radicata]